LREHCASASNSLCFFSAGSLFCETQSPLFFLLFCFVYSSPFLDLESAFLKSFFCQVSSVGKDRSLKFWKLEFSPPLPRDQISSLLSQWKTSLVPRCDLTCRITSPKDCSLVQISSFYAASFLVISVSFFPFRIFLKKFSFLPPLPRIGPLSFSRRGYSVSPLPCLHKPPSSRRNVPRVFFKISNFFYKTSASSSSCWSFCS